MLIGSNIILLVFAYLGVWLNVSVARVKIY